MCFFKKKAKITINSKFSLGEFVYFHYRDELFHGFVYNIKQDVDGGVIYDIQIGGECPVVKKDIKEEKVFVRK